jgi:hypothetical protein
MDKKQKSKKKPKKTTKAKMTKGEQNEESATQRSSSNHAFSFSDMEDALDDIPQQDHATHDDNNDEREVESYNDEGDAKMYPRSGRSPEQEDSNRATVDGECYECHCYHLDISPICAYPGYRW